MPHTQPVKVTIHCINKYINKVNSNSTFSVDPKKATGPDGITGRVVKDCVDQLAGVFTKIFNGSLSQSIIPSCLKASFIVPLPKKNPINNLSDYRAVALTS